MRENESKFRCQKKLTVPKDETQESSEKQNTYKFKNTNPISSTDKLKKCSNVLNVVVKIVTLCACSKSGLEEKLLAGEMVMGRNISFLIC